MYLSMTTTIAAISTFTGSPSGALNCTMIDMSTSTARPSLALRQGSIAPPPLPGIPQSTSVVFSTSVSTIFVTMALSSGPASRSPELISSSLPPPPSPGTTTPTETRSTQLITTTEISVSVPTSSASSGTTLIPTSSTGLTSTSPTASTSLPTASQSTAPASGPNPWANKGKVAGIAMGSVFGLILLGLIIYTLFAASRGINVCSCFGSCCRKPEDDEEKSRLPSHSSDTYPYPGAVNPSPGTGYYRPARPMSHEAQAPAPLPLMLPQQVAQDRRNVRFQRNPQRTLV